VKYELGFYIPEDGIFTVTAVTSSNFTQRFFATETSQKNLQAALNALTAADSPHLKNV
jgi:hypothetical protein